MSECAAKLTCAQILCLCKSHCLFDDSAVKFNENTVALYAVGDIPENERRDPLKVGVAEGFEDNYLVNPS